MSDDPIATLIETIYHQSEWRREKSVEYSDDERNLNASEGLDAMAEWIRAQPDESPVLYRFDAALDRLYSDPDGDGITFVPSVSDQLGRFRFNDPGETFEAFLVDLAKEIEEHGAAPTMEGDES